MGSVITEVVDRTVVDVRAAQAAPDVVKAGRRRLTGPLDRGVRRGRLSAEQRAQPLARLSFTHDLSDLADRQFVTGLRTS
ncbi:hypothetical protein GCM10011578_050230 [Streptomyces fuscichromogenes]|uniref:3-hydroxyacyl-CoA dehydrogenase NAD binding domain-containing protein n=2 Tax=Streptomyces fuscichromogenes TaxID=1324013 RepID=A0A918CT31_9ACTN|nr:hypothetical protein GCM10011578_050230 [Streptomyces fuscichromogenes]